MERIKKNPVGFFVMFVFLALFWTLVSGGFDWQHIILGIFLSFILVFYWADVLFDDKKTMSVSIYRAGGLLKYFACLIYEIVKANIKVAIIVLNPRLPISPGMVKINTGLKTDLYRVLYANSITLTPGTITVKMEGDFLLVHAITKNDAEGVEHWYMQNILLALEGKGN